MIVVPTIDVEGVHGFFPFEQMVLGQVDGGEYGVFEIDRMLRRHGAKGTFFVDVFETSLWGQDAFRVLCQKLDNNGQDVQLHTHPGWRDDRCDFPWLRKLKREKSYLSSNKDLMAKLSYTEQLSILREGADMIESWIGKRPLIHRSGGYSINEDTFRALEAAGFQMDSSVHFEHRNSKSQPTNMRALKYGRIFELPVTMMSYRSHLPHLSGKNLKTDIDTSWYSELVHYLEAGLSHNVRFMNLFMHSYSLIEFDPTYRKFRYSKRKAKILDNFLRYCLNHTKVKVLTCEQILNDQSLQDYLQEGSNEILELTARRHLAVLGARMIRNRFYEKYFGECLLKNFQDQPIRLPRS